METTTVSPKLLRRLPLYLNYIKSLPDTMENVSATQMAKALGLGDVMVRKDLAKVSDGGRRKLGYVREKLIWDIENFLDVNSTTCAVIVGAGKLGRALLDYTGFNESGLHVLAAFDSNAAAVRSGEGKPIYPMSELEDFCDSCGVRIGIIAVPAEHAQEVCDRMVSCGIEAIWNFAPVRLMVPDHVLVQNENLAVSLTALRVQLKNRSKVE